MIDWSRLTTSLRYLHYIGGIVAALQAKHYTVFYLLKMFMVLLTKLKYHELSINIAYW